MSRLHRIVAQGVLPEAVGTAAGLAPDLGNRLERI